MTSTPPSFATSKSNEQWKQELGDERFAVLREAATERPWSGALLDEKRNGVYSCGACGAELFQSGTKFDAGCGWPSFYESINPEAARIVVLRFFAGLSREETAAELGISEAAVWREWTYAKVWLLTEIEGHPDGQDGADVS